MLAIQHYINSALCWALCPHKISLIKYLWLDFLFFPLHIYSLFHPLSLLFLQINLFAFTFVGFKWNSFPPGLQLNPTLLNWFFKMKIQCSNFSFASILTYMYILMISAALSRDLNKCLHPYRFPGTKSLQTKQLSVTQSTNLIRIKFWKNISAFSVQKFLYSSGTIF